MFDELAVDLLISPLLRIGPFNPSFRHSLLEANVAFADSCHCLGLDGLVEALDLGKGMRFFPVRSEDFVRHGVIGLAIGAEDVFSRTDKTDEVGSLEIVILALLASLVKVDPLLDLPQYLVLLLQLASDVIGSKMDDIPHSIREVVLGPLAVLLGSH